MGKRRKKVLGVKANCPHLGYRRERVTTPGEASPSFVFFCTPVPRISSSDDRLLRYSLPPKKKEISCGVLISISVLPHPKVSKISKNAHPGVVRIN